MDKKAYATDAKVRDLLYDYAQYVFEPSIETQRPVKYTLNKTDVFGVGGLSARARNTSRTHFGVFLFPVPPSDPLPGTLKGLFVPGRGFGPLFI